MERKNKFCFFVFLLLVLSLCLFFFAMYLKYTAVLEVIEFDAMLRVGDVASFNVDTSALTFGTVTLNTSSQRTLAMKNNYGFPIKVEFSAEGDIEKFLVFEKIIFLDVEESRYVNVRTIILTDEKQGNYSGKFITTVLKSGKENSE